MLLKALASDPHSDEGWALYVANLYDLSNYEKIAEVIDTARLYAIVNRPMVEDVRHNTWIYLYNKGDSVFQVNPDSKEQQKSAIYLLESAKKVAPDQPETYEALGNVYLAANDTAKAMATYEEALKQVRPSHEQGVALGLILRMSPQTVESTIGGAPSKTTYYILSNGDSIMTYTYRSNDGYFYFERAVKSPRNWQLTGWRFTTTEAVGLQPMRISLQTYLALAGYYYNQGNMVLATNKAKAEDNFNRVVPLLISVQRLDPSDENATNIIPDIYAKLDQPEKAKSMYKKMLNEHPSKQLYASYGAVLLRSNDFQGGIEAYEDALKIDPAFENALYNLGVAYQNWAADIQKKDKKANVQPQLEKAVEYYEKVHSVNPKEYTALANLYSLYDILSKKDQKDKTLRDLEALKSTDVAKDKWYWNSMMKIYAANKNAKAADDAMKMYDSLNK
ncbi:MAG TPA: tetratricopeptide repeat protein [Candidatus Kapabacteria bacterium]|nr:tetratricopeptide repeat protein [Candidatus Kapabacteria bacterium]